MEEYHTRKVEEKHVTEIEDAVYHVISTAGYQNLLSEVCDISSDPLQTINMVTSCIRYPLKTVELPESCGLFPTRTVIPGEHGTGGMGQGSFDTRKHMDDGLEELYIESIKTTDYVYGRC